MIAVIENYPRLLEVADGGGGDLFSTEIRYKTKIDDLTTIPLTEFLDLVNNTKVIYKDVRIYDKEHKETGRKTVVLEGNHIMKKFNEVYISEASGVYYLTFLRALVELFEVEAGTALGRGFQAGEYITVIHNCRSTPFTIAILNTF